MIIIDWPDKWLPVLLKQFWVRKIMIDYRKNKLQQIELNHLPKQYQIKTPEYSLGKAIAAVREGIKLHTAPSMGLVCKSKVESTENLTAGFAPNSANMVKSKVDQRNDWRLRKFQKQPPTGVIKKRC